MEFKPSLTIVKFAQKVDLIALLGVCLYFLLTLMADSSSLLVSWPWVLVAQSGFILPWIWILRAIWRRQVIHPLGFGLDVGIGLVSLGFLILPFLTPFSQQTVWNTWAGFSGIAILYSLHQFLQKAIAPTKLLRLQGVLASAFILISLGLWTSQTWIPELLRIQALKSLGVDRSFSFAVLELRNWAPIGHQNYVAGHLVLSLPLLFGLCLIEHQPLRRWSWGILWGLGIVTLYTTSSRGGWLGLSVIGVLGFAALLSNRRVSTAHRALIGLGAVLVLGGLILVNGRLRSLFNLSNLKNFGGETAFRIITNWIGGLIGRDYPIFGAGPGSVSALYQNYRPDWAGQEAELVYQLHSTPAQIWAEFGAFGIILSLALVGWLLYWGIKLWRSPTLTGRDRVMTWSLLSGLAGYGVVALTDYQLDIIAIVGTLVVYLACFISLLRQYFPHNVDTALKPRTTQGICLGMTGLLIAMGIWLTPVLRAWQLSSTGFANLHANNIEGFKTNLERSHQLASWEPYYLHQLAWNLGNVGLQTSDPVTRQHYLQESQTYFTKSIKASPYQEFAYSNLGWLQLVTGQPEAVKTLAQATQLVPGKRLAFNSLGLSLLQQERRDEAVQAFSLEILRNPIWLTSPVWRSPQLQAVQGEVQELTKRRYQELLSEVQSDELKNYLHRCLGSLYWWQADFKQAQDHWEIGQSSAGLQLLAISQGNFSPSEKQPKNKESAIFQAWIDPTQRQSWVEKAILIARQTPPNENQVDSIIAGMNQAQTLDDWIKQYAPVREYRRERAGFGVLSRHIDGPAPVDFVPIVDNLAITLFFNQLFPNLQFNMELDQRLQPYREMLWQTIDPAQVSTRHWQTARF